MSAVGSSCPGKMSAVGSSCPGTGFSFKNCFRNTVLEKLNIKAPQPRKTGTTIAGVVFEDGVVLGADTRATEDLLIVDTKCHKIHFLAENIYCCGAGVAADTEAVSQIISANLELLRLDSNRLPRVRCATRLMKQMLYRYRGCLCASMIIGGVDVTGPHIACVYPHGSSDVLPYATMGSGALAAMAVLESGYKENMKVRAAKSLVKQSILAGVNNDLGSGAKVDICVIRKDRPVKYKQPLKTFYVKGKMQGLYTYEPGTTAVIKEAVENLDFEVTDSQTFPIDSDEDQDDQDDQDD